MNKSVFYPAFLFFFFFFLNSFGALSENLIFEKILNNDDIEKNSKLEEWAYHDLFYKEANEKIRILNEFEVIAQKRNDEIALRTIDFYRAYYVIALDSKKTELGLKLMNQIITKTEKNENLLQAAYFRHVLGYYYFTDHKDFVPALKNMLTAHYEFKKVDYKYIFDANGMLSRLAYLYFHLNNFNESIIYLNECLKYPITNSRTRIAILNAIGQSYREMHQLDSAVFFLEKSRNLSITQSDTTWLVINSNNLGRLFTDLNNIKKASPFIIDAFDNSKFIDNEVLKAETLINFGKLELENGRAKKALFFINQANSIFENQKYLPYEDYKRKFYLHKIYAQVYERLGFFNEAYKNLQQADLINDSINKRAILSKNITINQFFKTNLNNKKLDILTSERNAEILKNKLILAFIFLFLIIAILYYRNLKRDKKIAVQAQKILVLKNQQNEIELTQSKYLLDEYIRNLKEKNNLLEITQDELSNLKKVDAEINDHQIIYNLRQSTILTEDDWIKFKKLFEKVHLGFFSKLKLKFPELTPAEIRLLSLIKLDLNSHEMANMMGISIMGVKKNRQRLRKKLNLSELEKIENIVENI